MRMENLDLSQSIFEKLVALDDKDRIGAQALLESGGAAAGFSGQG